MLLTIMQYSEIHQGTFMLMVTNWCVIQLEREATLTTTNLDLLPRQTRTMTKK